MDCRRKMASSLWPALKVISTIRRTIGEVIFCIFFTLYRVSFHELYESFGLDATYYGVYD